MENKKKQYCDHDYDNPKVIGRAHYVCSKCGVDITLEVIMIEKEKLETSNG